MDIIVIGGGIVGLATSYWLARDGHRLTVIDAAASVGEGASFANGGQLSYDYVAPLASPAVLASLPRWLLSPGSPVKFRPSLTGGQLSWALSFLAACSRRRSRETTERLLALASFSRKALDELTAREGLAFAHRRNGKIVFYSTAAGLAGAVRQHGLQAELGSRQQLLSRDECIDLEPALRAAAGRIQGAIYTPSEELGDCLLLCQELRRVLERPPYRVQFHLGTAVEALLGERHRMRGVRLAGTVLEADLYVLAAGHRSRALARTLGLSLPLYPIRGYSISPALVENALAPEKSITDYEQRIVYARIGERLRVAGFADILPAAAAIEGRRVAALARATGQLFPGTCDLGDLKPWVGDRPATPGGVPIIGGVGWTNLLVNVGQGALGFTLAAGSGRMLADIVAGRRAELEQRDFALPEALPAEIAGASGRIRGEGI